MGFGALVGSCCRSSCRIKSSSGSRFFVAVTGGSEYDRLYDIAVDSNGNFFCVGLTTITNGFDSQQFPLIIKFDSSLNVLAQKSYGDGLTGGRFNSVSIDPFGNIVCVGELGGAALVVKLSPNLTILSEKIYGGVSDECFNECAIDTFGNIICVGYTIDPEGSGELLEALVVKFDTDLNVLAKKRYGHVNGSSSFGGVAVYSSSIVCVGYSSTNDLRNALIVKFDSNLAIVDSELFSLVAEEEIEFLSVDMNQTSIVCVGFSSLGQALVVKFDTNLNIVAQKKYEGTDWEEFYNVTINPTTEEIICVGAGEGSGDGSIVVFNQNLEESFKKTYGGSGSDSFYGVVIDLNNIICVGSTALEGSWYDDDLILKIPKSIPSGIFSGTVLPNLVLNDGQSVVSMMTLSLVETSLTLADSTQDIIIVSNTLNDLNLAVVNDSF